ncbi:hypothetical protein B0H17DRAFT_1182478 [Mycena rosella]|uniref:GIT Spa2 homology (SHD) domain-containing protein n=1 Tax=Mycena rosella TaxID=1033263 RepID=A0AAD7D5G5_MYCRO|nr:hypothetical protein B0H17DRAFT_1182478 [Mycena rosella]
MFNPPNRDCEHVADLQFRPSLGIVVQKVLVPPSLKVHFNELDRYLAVYLAQATPNSRMTARQKLTRLTIQQFHELSTDVYDELVRRKNIIEVIPFLPVRNEFHPKRNQARQKLATLPITRFEDLSGDVHFELGRRYPEFKEDPLGSTTRPPVTTFDFGLR